MEGKQVKCFQTNLSGNSELKFCCICYELNPILDDFSPEGPLFFVLSGMGNHWKVSSKEVMCSGLHFKRIALGASLVAQ